MAQIYHDLFFLQFEAVLLQGKLTPTWEISNLHVENKNSPRGREIKLRRNQMKLRRNQMKLRRNQMKLRRNFLFSTWAFQNLHVEITFPRHSPVSIRVQL